MNANRQKKSIYWHSRTKISTIWYFPKKKGLDRLEDISFLSLLTTKAHPFGKDYLASVPMTDFCNIHNFKRMKERIFIYIRILNIHKKSRLKQIHSQS